MPELARTKVALRVAGDDLDPQEVTRLLGAEPTSCARKGETRRSASGRETAARTGIWLLSVEPPSPGDLNAQVRALLARVTGDLSVWRDLSRRHRCDVFCGLFLRDGNEGAELAPETLTMLGERGLALGLDIYGPP
jgi:hypothetical protein